MSLERMKLAAGNWKMNGLAADLDEITALIAAHPAPEARVAICPPATLIAQAAERAAGSQLWIGAQDCHTATSGAHTGDLSAPMLHDAGARLVILGHSERRRDHDETDALVAAKALAAAEEQMTAIICLGETEAEREAGTTLAVVEGQLAGSVPAEMDAWNALGKTLVIAYEPVWAIGTGRTPTLEQIAEVHDHLRALLVARFGAPGAAVSLLYGGSVKPANAAGIFALENVNGALVGGASLKAADFGQIIAALNAAPGR